MVLSPATFDPTAASPTPSHALNADERTRVLQLASEPRFTGVPPARSAR